MDPSSVRATSPPTKRSRRALPATAVVTAVLGVLTAVTWVTGGLRAQSASPEPVVPGGTVDQTRFTVKVRGARTATVKIGLDDKPVPVLAVRMRVTNTGNDTVTLDDTTFGFTAGVFLGPGRLREPDDVQSDLAMGTVESVPPRMSREVAVIWKLTGPAPQQVTVHLREWDYHLSFDRSEYYWWVDQGSPIAAKVTLPVQQGGIG